MIKTFNNIIELLFGKKYYLCVVHRVGTDIYEVNSTLFKTKAEVNGYKNILKSTRAFEWAETLTIRTRTDYTHVREM